MTTKPKKNTTSIVLSAAVAEDMRHADLWIVASSMGRGEPWKLQMATVSKTDAERQFSRLIENIIAAALIPPSNGDWINTGKGIVGSRKITQSARSIYKQRDPAPVRRYIPEGQR